MILEGSMGHIYFQSCNLNDSGLYRPSLILEILVFLLTYIFSSIQHMNLDVN